MSVNIPVEIVVCGVGGIGALLTLNAHLLFALYTRLGSMDTRFQIRLGNLETRVFGASRSTLNAGENAS